MVITERGVPAVGARALRIQGDPERRQDERRATARGTDSQHNDIPLVLATYNAGPTAVARYGGVLLFERRGTM